MNKLTFIIYESRSGSTFLSQKMNASFNCVVAPETQLPINLLLKFTSEQKLFPKDIEQIISMVDNDRKIADWEITDKIKICAKDFVGHSVDEFLTSVFKIYLDCNKSDAKTFLVLKKESYTLVFPRIKNIFPTSKFIYVLRDPRGVFASKKTSNYTLTGKPFDTSAISSSLSWVKRLDCVSLMLSKHPKDVLCVKYEDLLLNEDAVLEKISRFLCREIKKSDRKIKVHERYNILHENLFKGTLKDNETKWVGILSDREVYIIQKICGNHMRDMDYLPVQKRNINKCWWYLHLISVRAFRVLINFLKRKLLNIFRSGKISIPPG